MATNGQRIERLYESFAQGDVGAVHGAFDERIDWQEPESLPFENQVGPQAVAENIFSRVIELVENFSVAPSEIHDAGDVVFAIGTYSGTGAATSKALETPFVHVWRVKDGKVSGFRNYTDTHGWLQVLGEPEV